MWQTLKGKRVGNIDSRHTTGKTPIKAGGVRFAGKQDHLAHATNARTLKLLKGDIFMVKMLK